MNVRDLHEKLRTTFACIDGVPRAYMEIRCPLPNQQIHITGDGRLFAGSRFGSRVSRFVKQS